MAAEGVDEARQSRTLYVLGAEAMGRMAKSNCFLSGMSGLGVEIAKNVILTGVKSFTIHDTKSTTHMDLSTQFFLGEEDIGKNRATQSASQLAELNPSVSLRTSTEDLSTIDLAFFNQFTVVILVDSPLHVQMKVNAYCRGRDISFISAEMRGVFGWTFVDVGESFDVLDKNGEELPDIMLSDISSGSPGVCTTLEHHRHDLETGDCVEFREIVGMPELNGTRHTVTVIDPHHFSIGDTSTHGAYVRDGIASLVKLPTDVSSKPLAAAVEDPEILTVDFTNLDAPPQMHLGMRALHAFWAETGSLPRPWNAEDAEALIAKAKAIDSSNVKEEMLRQLSYTAVASLPPLCAFFGGFVAQEALKTLTHKFTPLKQWLYVNAIEAMPPTDGSVDPASCMPTQSRNDGLRVCIGDRMCQKLADSRVFVVGAGAIGCEMLKNFALLGVGTGQGEVIVTDNDVIEVSNLSRQFLFRGSDVSKAKSECAAAAAMQMNPAMKVDARLDRVGRNSEHIYTHDFFDGLDCCVNALDNVGARLYMDSRCVVARKPLLESGTLGTKGHVQVIVPYLTESYASTHDPPEKDVPFCTIKSFPYQIQHTIQFARDKFAELFANLPADINKFFEAGTPDQIADQLKPGAVESFHGIVQGILARPSCFADCLQFARLRFETYFANTIKQLLHAFPVDHVMKDGSLFWTLPKRPPTPLTFDAEDPAHRAAVVHMAVLWARVWGVPPEGTDSADAMRQALKGLEIPSFVPRDGVEIETDESALKPQDSTEAEELDAERVAALEQQIREGFRATTHPEVFEKDDDANSHIDFVTALSNLRARCYTIPEADRLTTKRIAGKIIPAISTTTAAVSGLVALELIKVLDWSPGPQGEARSNPFKNAFINLALPLMALSEPGDAAAQPVCDGLSFTLWDTWDVHWKEVPLLSDFVGHFKKKYGLTVKGVFLDASAVYMSVFPTHKKRLKKKLVDLLKLKGAKPRFVTLTVSFADAQDQEVEGPSVRVVFG